MRYRILNAALLMLLLMNKCYSFKPDTTLSQADSNILERELSPECQRAMEDPSVAQEDLSDECKQQIREINDVLTMARNRAMKSRPPPIVMKKWYQHPVTITIFSFVFLLFSGAAAFVVYVNTARKNIPVTTQKKISKKKV